MTGKYCHLTLLVYAYMFLITDWKYVLISELFFFSNGLKILFRDTNNLKFYHLNVPRFICRLLFFGFISRYLLLMLP